jgi:tetratricopeptide (TPR) repeat protein
VSARSVKLGTIGYHPPVRRICEEHTPLVLAGVVGLALGLRVFALWSLSRGLYGTSLMPDEQVYDAWARLLLEGKPVPRVYDFPSAPAYVFAALYRVFGASSGVIRVFDTVLGSATCGVMYAAGARAGGRFAGVVCALLAASYGPFVLFSVTAHHTALGLFAFACMLAAAALCFERATPLRAAGFGVALAVATWMRPNSLALALAGAGWLIVTAVRTRGAPLAARAAPLCAFAAGVSLLLLPGAGSVPEPAFNFYLANTLDNPTPYFRPVRFASSEPSQQAMGFVVAASVQRGRALSLAEAHDYWLGELGREWRAQPGAAIAKLAAKAGAVLHPYEAANNHNLAFLRRYVAGLALPYANFALVFALAMIALPTALRSGQRAARGLAWLALTYALTLLLFFADSRLRAPLALALLPFSALGVIALLEAEPARRMRLALAAAAIITAQYALPVPGAGDLSTAYNFHALFLFDRGELDQAAAFYRESAELGGSDSPSAYLGLAAIAQKQGDFAAAERDLSLIPDAHYKAAEKYVQLGSLYVRTHRFPAAAAAFEHALAINPSTLDVYPLLIALYEHQHASTAAAEVRRKYAFVARYYSPPGSAVGG